MITALLFGFFALSPATGFIFNQHPFTCTVCQNVHSWNDCSVETCQHGEMCSITVIGDHHFPTVNSGCVQSCPAKVHGFHSKCHECCHGDNCNFHHCKDKVPGFISQVPIFGSHNSQRVNICHKCAMVGFSWNCDGTVHCQSKQACFYQEYGTGLYPAYTSGCIDEEHCREILTKDHKDHSGDNSVPDQHLDHLPKVPSYGMCCYTDACNNPLQKNKKVTTRPPPMFISTTTTTTPSTTPKVVIHNPAAGASVCKTCTTSDSGISCTKTEVCSTNQIQACYIMEENEVGLPLAIKSGCIDKQYCTSIEFDVKTAILTRRGRCCYSDSCNDKSLLDQPATTTKAPVTAMTGHSCELCSDENCQSTFTIKCPDTHPLCLTSVKNENGKIMRDKRCATFTECARRWLVQTSVKPECTSLADHTPYSNGLDCTYCCKADGCNRDTVPPAGTLIYKLK